jgi:general secretion pathway protein I
MEPYVDPLKRRSPQTVSSAPRLLQVRLQVEWGDAPGQRLRWQTLRLAPADINASALVP